MKLIPKVCFLYMGIGGLFVPWLWHISTAGLLIDMTFAQTVLLCGTIASFLMAKETETSPIDEVDTLRNTIQELLERSSRDLKDLLAAQGKVKESIMGRYADDGTA